MGFPVTATTIHQPFNPIEGEVNLDIPYYEQEQVYLAGDLDPNANFTHDSAYVPSSINFPNGKGCIYHDPFPMLNFVFTHRTKTGTWAGGAGTYGKLIGDFTDDDDRDSHMIQGKIVDDAGTVVYEGTLLGVMCEEYRIGFKKNGFLREYFKLKCGKELDNTRSYAAVASFDDGKWADWAKSTFYHANNCKIYWDDSFTAELTEFKVEDAEFIIKMPRTYETDASSLITQAGYDVDKERSYEAKIMGIVYGDAELDEWRAAYTSKTKKNLRLSWDQTANETKFLDFDDAFISGFDSVQIPKASEVWKVTLTFKAYTADYEGNFLNLADPTTRVNA